jgi:hypothetical protein
MNLKENISRIKEMMGISESERKTLNFSYLVNKGVLWITEPYENGELVPSNWYGDSNIVTLWNLQNPEEGQEWVYDAIKHPKSEAIQYWTDEGQFALSKEKYEQILRSIKMMEKKSGEKWIKCVNCNKKFTQTIHKGKKSLPICPHCGTNNDLVTESEIPIHFKRRLFEVLPNFIRDEYQLLAPWSFNSYEEYMSKIIFNVVREISHSSGDTTYEEIREKIEPLITNYIINNFSDEIEEYYSDNMTPG